MFDTKQTLINLGYDIIDVVSEHYVTFDIFIIITPKITVKKIWYPNDNFDVHIQQVCELLSNFGISPN